MNIRTSDIGVLANIGKLPSDADVDSKAGQLQHKDLTKPETDKR